MRLLLVEDERKLSQVLAKGLKKLSYAVDQAFDGEEALELFSVYGYDLVVLDLNLPKIDGWEVLRQIRQQDRQVKVLICRRKIRWRIKSPGWIWAPMTIWKNPLIFWNWQPVSAICCGGSLSSGKASGRMAG